MGTYFFWLSVHVCCLHDFENVKFSLCQVVHGCIKPWKKDYWRATWGVSWTMNATLRKFYIEWVTLALLPFTLCSLCPTPLPLEAWTSSWRYFNIIKIMQYKKKYWIPDNGRSCDYLDILRRHDMTQNIIDYEKFIMIHWPKVLLCIAL